MFQTDMTIDSAKKMSTFEMLKNAQSSIEHAEMKITHKQVISKLIIERCSIFALVERVD